MEIAKAAIAHVWDRIKQLEGETFLTPAEKAKFKLVSVHEDGAKIRAQDGEGAAVNFTKASFQRGVAYLIEHGHIGSAKSCPIGSNLEYDKAGPLCQATRGDPTAQMNVTYILPILKRIGFVEISQSVPSSTWLTASSSTT